MSGRSNEVLLIFPRVFLPMFFQSIAISTARRTRISVNGGRVVLISKLTRVDGCSMIVKSVIIAEGVVHDIERHARDVESAAAQRGGNRRAVTDDRQADLVQIRFARLVVIGVALEHPLHIALVLGEQERSGTDRVLAHVELSLDTFAREDDVEVEREVFQERRVGLGQGEDDPVVTFGANAVHRLDHPLVRRLARLQPREGRHHVIGSEWPPINRCDFLPSHVLAQVERVGQAIIGNVPVGG